MQASTATKRTTVPQVLEKQYSTDTDIYVHDIVKIKRTGEVAKVLGETSKKVRVIVCGKNTEFRNTTFAPESLTKVPDPEYDELNNIFVEHDKELRERSPVPQAKPEAEAEAEAKAEALAKAKAKKADAEALAKAEKAWVEAEIIKLFKEEIRTLDYINLLEIFPSYERHSFLQTDILKLYAEINNRKFITDVSQFLRIIERELETNKLTFVMDLHDRFEQTIVQIEHAMFYSELFKPIEASCPRIMYRVNNIQRRDPNLKQNLLDCVNIAQNMWNEQLLNLRQNFDLGSFMHYLWDGYVDHLASYEKQEIIALVQIYVNSHTLDIAEEWDSSS